MRFGGATNGLEEPAFGNAVLADMKPATGLEACCGKSEDRSGDDRRLRADDEQSGNNPYATAYGAFLELSDQIGKAGELRTSATHRCPTQIKSRSLLFR